MNKILNPDKIRKFFVVLMIFLCTGALAQQRFSIELKNVTVKTALEELKNKSTYSLWFSPEDIDLSRITSVSVKEGTIQDALGQIFSGQNLHYTINGKQVIIEKEKSTKRNSLISGYVLEGKSNTPLVGAVVIVKGSTHYTTTDENGKYEIKAPVGSLLEVNLMGYNTAEQTVLAKGNLNFRLEEQVIALDEVVVTGFQTISRERSTGSATIVSKENLDKIQSTNLSEKLEGSVPGLSTYNGNISIRGISSFAINSTPLLVLDGQPVTGINLNEINPEDIQNITVLKDAAATSLYGVRASNGVIVVTTKKGNSAKPQINVSAGFYFNPLPSMDYQHLASTGDMLDYEVNYLLNNPTYQADPSAYFNNMNSMDAPQYLSGVDRLYFQKANGEISDTELNASLKDLRKNDYRKEYRDRMQKKTHFTQDYNLSISKGNEESNLFFSGRFEERGSYNYNETNRKVTLYFKNELKLAKWMSITYGANLASGRYEYGTGNHQGEYTAMPYDRLFEENGAPAYMYPYNYFRAQKINETEGLNFMGYNAWEERQENRVKTKDLYWKGFGQADFRIIEGLSAGVKFQYEERYQDNEEYNSAASYTMREQINKFAVASTSGNGFDYYLPEGGHLKETHGKYAYMNLRAQIDYKKSWNKKHDFTALLGGEIREDNSRISRGERYGFDDQKLTFQQVDYKTLSQGITGQLGSRAFTMSEVVGVSEVKHRYVSAYLNAGYSYAGRYALNASVRVEQADLFGSDPKYRYRPLWSIGASWNISNEAFMKNTQWVNMLKLRATYGITGNVDQSSSPYLLGQYVISPYSFANLTSIMSPPNKSLRWEKTSTLNAGIDFLFIKKLSGSFDFYHRYSSDLLANKSLDPSTGFPQGRMNNGAMSNTGFELNLSYAWINTGNWNFTTTFTVAHNKNRIEEVGYLPTDALSMMSYPTSNYLQGDTYNSLYAYKYAGLTQNGDPSIYNEKGEVVSISPVRDINALVRMGQLDPKWNGSLDLSLRWKSLNLFAKIVYYAGHSLRADATPLYSGVRGGAIHEEIVNRWTPENTHTDIPSMNVYGNQGDRNTHWKYSDYQVVSASFIKMRNIGLSYSLPTRWMNKCGFRGMSIRGQVNNPFYWAANDRDIDPEAFYANSGSRAGQQVTSYTLGINLNF